MCGGEMRTVLRIRPARWHATRRTCDVSYSQRARSALMVYGPLDQDSGGTHGDTSTLPGVPVSLSRG